VERRTPAVLRADISDGQQRFERRAPILVVPGSDDGNGERPVVTGFAAGASDTTTEPTITLNISATDDVSVTRMYVREWQLSARPFPRWEPVRSSGWLPFQRAFPWTLGAANGVHIVGVWVEDAAGNRSALTHESTDVVNLVRPNATVARGGVVPYLVRYEAGVDVQLTLETTSGDADLYVWYPHSFRLADEISANEGTATDSVRFAAPLEGYYLIAVYGSESSSYNLSIAPGGGAQGAVPAQAAALPSSKQPSLVSPLAEAGTSPLGSDSASEPAAGATVYLPLVTK
ncbi:MAG: PPC domain-containing protein, partial [Chloroflexales bacterium]|nr:PPC domain-containing protein [Chloroflexales bacterium]